MQAQKIPVNLIDQNLLNPNEMDLDQFQKLRENIRKTNQYPSLIVLKQNNRFLLIDGHNRLEILKDLGIKEAWCEVWELDQKHADLLLATLNRLHGVDDIQKRAKLFKKIKEEFDGLEDFYELLPESAEAIESYLEIAEKEIDDLADSFDKEIIKGRLEQVVDKDLANKLSKVANSEKDGKMKLVFRFDNEDDYMKSMRYFGYEPDPNKLIELISR